jgi:hypothetical protein
MQVFWPDPEPRITFQQQVQEWSAALSLSKGIPDVEGLIILHQGLILATQEYPLPFVRRTILEFVLSGQEGLAWWDGLTGLCAGYGLRVGYLDSNEIESLIRWMLNPHLEYKNENSI